MTRLITPIKDIEIVYDDLDPVITRQARDVDNVLNSYNVEVKCVKATEYDGQDENAETIVYLVSVETEQFHKTVKPKLLSYNQTQSSTSKNSANTCRLLAVLKHSSDDVKFVNKFIKDMHKKLKSNTSIKCTKKLEEPLICILDWSDVASWWPMVLYFIQGRKHAVVTSKEIGAYFHINPDVDTQMQWFAEHRKTLEDTFLVKCAYGAKNTDNEKVINNSLCAVIYVREESLKNRKVELSKDQSKLISYIKSGSCKLHVYVDRYGEDNENTFNKRIVEDYGLVLRGNGMLIHWVGLMNHLGLTKLRYKPDLQFYSMESDDNLPDRFATHDTVIDRVMTTMTSRSGYMGDATVDDIQTPALTVDRHGIGFHDNTDGGTNLDRAIYHISYQLPDSKDVTDATVDEGRNCCAFFPFLTMK